MHQRLARRVLPVIILPLLVAAGGCDIVSAGFGSEETAQWQKTYTLPANGRLEIANRNGRITVEPSTGNTVEVTAIKKAKAGSPEAAKAELQRIQITEDVSSSGIRIETKIDRPSGGLNWSGSNGQVEYHVKVPSAADVKFATVNGGIDLHGLNGRIQAQTTNGGVRGSEIGGPIVASTTNGGVDVDLTRVAGDVKLECTNGGIKVQMPSDSRATISASLSNGTIGVSGLSLETTESSRRRLEARLNGGGPKVELEGTNGGISLRAR
jgi:hypothetical protein